MLLYFLAFLHKEQNCDIHSVIGDHDKICKTLCVKSGADRFSRFSVTDITEMHTKLCYYSCL